MGDSFISVAANPEQRKEMHYKEELAAQKAGQINQLKKGNSNNPNLRRGTNRLSGP
jgi:hypothetical protein